MTISNRFKGILPIRRIITLVVSLITLVVTLSLLIPGSSFAGDFKIPQKGYHPKDCALAKSICESSCKGSENLSACQNCCKRDWYLCLQAEGLTGKPGDTLQPDDLAEYIEKCGENVDAKRECATPVCENLYNEVYKKEIDKCNSRQSKPLCQVGASATANQAREECLIKYPSCR